MFSTVSTDSGHWYCLCLWFDHILVQIDCSWAVLVSLCLVLLTKRTHALYARAQMNTHTCSPMHQMAMWGDADGGGCIVPDQYALSHSDCIIIILMTAVFSPVMASEMNKTTPEVCQSSLLLESAGGLWCLKKTPPSNEYYGDLID